MPKLLFDNTTGFFGWDNADKSLCHNPTPKKAAFQETLGPVNVGFHQKANNSQYLKVLFDQSDITWSYLGYKLPKQIILHQHIGYSLVLSIPQDLLEAEEGAEKGDLQAMSIVKHHAEVFLDRHKRNALHAAFLSPLKYLFQDVYEIFENLDSDFAKDLVG